VTAGDWGLIGVILLLIFLAAILAAAEVATTRVNKIRARHWAEEERRGAATLVKIVENPSPYLSAVLLLLLLFHLTGTTMATVVAIRVFGDIGEIVATAVMTLVLFVFAEVTPKTFAVQHTERVALFLAPLIYFLGRALGPVARGLIGFANIILPGKGLPEGPFVTEQELRALAEVASEEESIEEGEKELIHSIFEFGDTIVREVMVPRPDIVAVDVKKTLRQVQEVLIRHGYSRLPVYREQLDDIVGILYAKDVLKAIHQRKSDAAVEDLVRKAHFVPESKKVAELLREMQREKFHIALVTDEYGSVNGLVTLEDLLEELVGEITDEYDREEPQIEPVDEDTFRVDARVSIDDLNEILEAKLPDTEWDTVGGLIQGLLGAIPRQGEEVTFEHFRFVAERVKGRRIGKVLVQRLPQQDAKAKADGRRSS
jgi:CBS domain containing-hemolysin-like protein